MDKDKTRHLWGASKPGFEEPQVVNVPTIAHVTLRGSFVGAFEEYELWELYGRQYHVNVQAQTVTPA